MYSVHMLLSRWNHEPCMNIELTSVAQDDGSAVDRCAGIRASVRVSCSKRASPPQETSTKKMTLAPRRSQLTTGKERARTVSRSGNISGSSRGNQRQWAADAAHCT